MKIVLIVVWMVTSQGYMRSTEQWLEVAMQEFDNEAACEHAAKVISESWTGGVRKPSTRCVPKNMK